MAFAAAAPFLIQGAASLGSAALTSLGKGKESKLERTKRKLVDKLLASINGEGEFSSLFNVDNEAFQKGIVEPAQSRFKNQISPQIQQSYIASGQQRGTGLEDTLTRAGVDLNQQINEQYYKYVQDMENRKLNAISGILGTSGGAEPTSTGEDILSAAGGYLGSEKAGEGIQGILDYYKKSSPGAADTRKGFEPS